MSRGFLREPKSSRASGKFYGEGPLSGRTMNDGYCQEPLQRTNYNSRQFQPGIFTNQLNRKAEMGRKRQRQQPKEIPLELTEIVDYSNLKTRSSKKNYEFPILSREESLHSYHQQQYINTLDERQLREEMKAQMQQIADQAEYHCIEKVKRMMNEQSARIKENFNDLIRQTNSGFMKKEETLQSLRNQTFSIKDELSQFKRAYQIFSEESEEKLENLCMEMGNLGVKRSKINGDYNVDLKNSFQGMNSSFSVNLGGESQGSKIVNEVICQLDAQKKELSDTKQLIEDLNEKINLKLHTLNLPPESKIENKEADKTFQRDEVMKMIKDAFGEDVKRSKFLQKVDELSVKIRDLETIMFKQEQNIAGMNDEFANSVNHQINPKIKKIEAAMTDIYSKVDKNEFTKIIKQEVAEEVNEKLKDTKVLKIRSSKKEESDKLSIISGTNEDKISYKETYLLDQENYLLDSEGNYIVEEVNSQKQRIRIDDNMIYLLQLKGIEIMAST